MEPNPIGESKIEGIKKQIQEVIQYWNDHQPNIETIKKNTTAVWFQVVDFLIKSADYFIRSADINIEGGPDKKATVIKALSEVYDVIIPVLLPIWLKPFSVKIKSFIFNIVLSIAIDFIVSKYRSNEWNKKTGFI